MSDPVPPHEARTYDIAVHAPQEGARPMVEPMVDLDPWDCPHEEAVVEAHIGGSAQDPPGVAWEVLAPEQRDLDGVRATVTLGVCASCSSRVVSVRAWDQDSWTTEHGPAWTSRWTRLVRDGEQP